MAESSFWGGSGSRGNGDSEIVFSNVRILDGTGEQPYSGEVTVSGNRIRSISRGGGGLGGGLGGGGLSWSGNGGQRIDGRGMTLMPGLIDSHLHLSWNNAPGIDPIQMMPTEEHVVNCVEMARLLIDSGFTGASARRRLSRVSTW